MATRVKTKNMYGPWTSNCQDSVPLTSQIYKVLCVCVYTHTHDRFNCQFSVFLSNNHSFEAITITRYYNYYAILRTF
jgi:ferredoxin-thioredoxin reductase catalytic subunit